MSETAFTPGPWAYNSPDIYRRVFGTFSDVAVYAGVSFPWRMAEIAGPDDQTAIANALLIAAAPELYEALVKAREYVGDEFESGPRDLAMIDAVLAKARGETSNV